MWNQPVWLNFPSSYSPLRFASAVIDAESGSCLIFPLISFVTLLQTFRVNRVMKLEEEKYQIKQSPQLSYVIQDIVFQGLCDRKWRSVEKEELCKWVRCKTNTECHLFRFNTPGHVTDLVFSLTGLQASCRHTVQKWEHRYRDSIQHHGWVLIII